MPGRLSRNFRLGHRSEDIGVVFFRTFSAVSSIRQEDDTGNDLVSTLLRKDGNLLFAENSFFVQIKSVSVTEVIYKNDEINWFINQDLPFFICTVDKEKDIIKIYTTNRAYQIIGGGSCSELKLLLDDSPVGYLPNIRYEDDSALISLGPPIIISSLQESFKESEAQRIYDILKIWSTLEHEQTHLRKLGFSKLAIWETHGSPTYTGSSNRGSQENLKRDLLAAKPYLEYLANHLEFLNDDKEEKTKIFRALKNWYKEFDISPSFEIDKTYLMKNDEGEFYTE